MGNDYGSIASFPAPFDRVELVQVKYDLHQADYLMA